MDQLKRPISLESAVESGRLKSYLRRYLQDCAPSSEEERRRGVGRFPNLAGFCRFLGCGISEAEALRLTHPAAHDYLCAVMEDEALNVSHVSPTLVTSYLKRRLGYAERSEPTSQAECGQMRIVFEHDIEEDGT